MAEPIKPLKPLKKKSNGSAYNFQNSKKKVLTAKGKASSRKDSGIPKPVANRMARRIAILTGFPTFTGMSIFVLSYLAVSKGIMDIPPVITLATSAACFLIGLIGLSYGMLSASWEESPGTLLGLENIQPNIGRMRSAFTKPKQPESSKEI